MGKLVSWAGVWPASFAHNLADKAATLAAQLAGR
jgi:hypothetical protein